MMETELTSQEQNYDFSLNQFTSEVILSKYAKINSKEEELYIDPKDIQLGSSSEKMITGSIASLDSEDLSGPISIEVSKHYLYKKLGNCYSFLGNKKGDPLFIIGPDWKKFIYLFFAITVVFLCFCKEKWQNLSGFMKFVGLLFYFSYFISHIYTEIINPGHPKHNLDSKTGEPRKKFDYCSICKIWVNKELNTKHCERCDICIEGHINHYKWTSKCIGKNNQMFYYIFLISLAFMFGYIFCILATKSKQVTNNVTKKYL